MKEEIKTPKRWISIRVKPQEYATIFKHFKATTCSKLSKYIRQVLLQKPVHILYKDESTREILSALNQLSRELSALQNNFNQAVVKLNTLGHIAEIKMWIDVNELAGKIVLAKIEEIRNSLNEIRKSCAHK